MRRLCVTLTVAIGFRHRGAQALVRSTLESIATYLRPGDMIALLCFLKASRSVERYISPSASPEHEPGIPYNQPKAYDTNQGANHTSGKDPEIPSAALSCGGGVWCAFRHRSGGDRFCPDGIEVPLPISVQVSPVGNTEVGRDRFRESKRGAFKGSPAREEYSKAHPIFLISSGHAAIYEDHLCVDEVRSRKLCTAIGCFSQCG